MSQNRVPRLPGRTTLPLWQRAVLFCVAYFVCAEAGHFLSARNTTYVSFWLPAGLYVAVLLLNDRRDWRWLVLAALPANLAFDLLHGTKFVTILFFYCANTVQAVTGAWLVRRFVAERPTLRTLEEFAGLLGFAAVLSTMLGATIGAATLTAAGLSQSFAESWKVWWGSCAMAILLFTPFILTWCSRANAMPPRWRQPEKILEAAALLLGLLVLTWHLLFQEQGIMTANKSEMLLPLLWAGLRFGPRGAAAANLLVSLLVAFFTTQFFKGLTPDQVSSGDYVFNLQSSLAVAALVGLIPAIILHERDQTMAELRESEERSRNLTAAAFEGIGINENGRIVDVNEQMLRMFGYTRDEMIGREVIELIAPESRDLVAEAIRTGRESLYEHRLLRKDGSSFEAEARARVVRVGDRTLRMTALRDISERKLAEAALRNSEESLRATIENTPYVAVQWYDMDGRVLLWNRASEIIFGWQADEARGKLLGELIFEADEQARYAEVLAEIRRTGKPVGPTEYRFHRRDNSHGICLSTTFRIPYAANKACFVCMDVDITERKAAEELLRLAQERELSAREEFSRHLLTAQEQERKRLAGELHDSLGQNLSVIKNNALLALQQPDLPPAARQRLEAISQFTSDAIAEVRSLAQNLRPLQIEQLGLTDSLAGLVEKVAQSTGIRIERRLEKVDEVFTGEAATHVYRILQEVLNNLIKHSGADHATVTLERDVHFVRLRVTDNGSGFEVQKKSARSGLGLTSIGERARMLGGSLKIQSVAGEGTSLTIELPIADGAAVENQF